MKAALISLGSKSSVMIAEEMKKTFDVVDMLDIRAVEVTVGKGAEGVLYQGKPVTGYDCVFVRGSYKYASIQTAITSKLAGTCFMPYASQSFTIVHDKLLTHLELEQFHIPMPKTYLTSSVQAARLLLKEITYPIIMKIPRGTQGKGVMFSDSYAAAVSVLDTLTTLKQPFLIQEFVDTGGSDIRAIVVGDTVVASMKRIASSGDKRSNLHAGGTTEVFEPSAHVKKIAVQTAQALHADICGVDVLEGSQGPLVIEANLSPGLQGITKATGINVAKFVAEYLAVKTRKFIMQKNESLSSILQEQGIGELKTTHKTLFSQLDFRLDRIMLPKVVTEVTQLKESDDCAIEFSKGSISIKKL